MEAAKIFKTEKKKNCLVCVDYLDLSCNYIEISFRHRAKYNIFEPGNHH